MKLQILVLASQLIFPLWFGPGLKAADPFEKETVVCKEVGPLGIKADVYHYNDAKVRPVVVSLHGGALIMGHRENIAGPVKDFALSNGYVLVSFDYRLARRRNWYRGLDDGRRQMAALHQSGSQLGLRVGGLGVARSQNHPRRKA